MVDNDMAPAQMPGIWSTSPQTSTTAVELERPGEAHYQIAPPPPPGPPQIAVPQIVRREEAFGNEGPVQRAGARSSPPPASGPPPGVFVARHVQGYHSRVAPNTHHLVALVLNVFWVLYKKHMMNMMYHVQSPPGRSCTSRTYCTPGGCGPRRRSARPSWCPCHDNGASSP